MMSDDKTSTESNNAEQTSEGGSEAIFQPEDVVVNCSELVSFRLTTLQDLPFEVMEFILIKAVVMDVKDMKLARRVRKEKADLVMDRFRTVCSQWSSVLSTNFFRKEVHRILDDTVEEVIRMNIRHQSPSLKILVLKLTTTKDEMFILCRPNAQDDYAINVYDCNNTCMSEVKDVIPLPGIRPKGLAACNVSNCVYLLNKKHSYLMTVLRITRNDAEDQFTLSPWKTLWLTNLSLYVTPTGRIILARQRVGDLAVINVYGANGCLQHQLKLSSDISTFSDIIAKRDGTTLVLVSINHEYRKKLTEVDMDGNILRQYNSTISEYRGVVQADIYGRLLITDRLNRMELLDSQFNLLDYAGPATTTDHKEQQLISPYKLHYNRERNEIISVVEDKASAAGSVLTIFHFTEEL